MRDDPEHLRTLIQEAYDLFTNPESQIDLRDWIKSANPYVTPTARTKEQDERRKRQKSFATRTGDEGHRHG